MSLWEMYPRFALESCTVVADFFLNSGKTEAFYMLQVKATTCKVIKGIFTFSDQEIYWSMYSYNCRWKKKTKTKQNKTKITLDVGSNSVHSYLF